MRPYYMGRKPVHKPLRGYRSPSCGLVFLLRSVTLLPVCTPPHSREYCIRRRYRISDFRDEVVLGFRSAGRRGPYPGSLMPLRQIMELTRLYSRLEEGFQTSTLRLCGKSICRSDIQPK